MGQDSQAAGVMSLRDFCKEWARLGWIGRFKRAKEFHGAAALACGFLALLIREWWPAMSPALSFLTWAPFLLFGAVFVAALAYGLITAPYAIYAAQAEKAKAAEDVIRDLQRVADPACEFVDPGDMRSGRLEKLAPATVHRIALKNLSPSTQLTGVEVTLLRYTDLQTGKTVSISKQLYDLRGNHEVVIAPGDMRHFNVVAVRPEKSPPRIYFAPPPEGISPHRADTGQYDLEVQAVTATAPPVPARFLLEVDRGGKVKLKVIT